MSGYELILLLQKKELTGIIIPPLVVLCESQHNADLS